MGAVGAVRGRGTAGVRSMRRCGVCFVVVHGRVEVAGFENTGVPSGGSCSAQSRILDLSAAFSVQDDVLAPCSTADLWDWFSSDSAVPTCESVCSTVFGVPGSGPSIVCLSQISNCRKPNASLLYLASSAPRLGPETCTRISICGSIVYLHLEKSSLEVVRELYLYAITPVCSNAHLQ